MSHSKTAQKFCAGPSPPGIHAEVNMQRPPTFFVGFGKGAPDAIHGVKVQSVLRRTLHYVTKDVITPLRPFLSDH